MKNKNITFDRLRLSLPASAVKIRQQNVFQSTVSGTGELLRSKYVQTTPFYYSIEVDEQKHTTIVEFNGKVLLDRYPELINSMNITACFENINQCGVCDISIDEAIISATVQQCDVTRDVSSESSIKDILLKLTFKNNNKWSVRDKTSNRFTIESTCTTKRRKSRMVVYDKALEMTRKDNEAFLQTVSNPEEQIQYFTGKIRYELNLNSIDRIRKYFGVRDTKLLELLNSISDPIHNFLVESVVDQDYINQTANLAGNLRTLEHILLIAGCDYDMRKLEMLVRDLYGPSRSVSRAMKSYQKIYATLVNQIPEPLQAASLLDIRQRLIKALSSLFQDEDGDNNILQIYRSQLPVMSDYNYFDLPFVRIPFMPD